MVHGRTRRHVARAVVLALVVTTVGVVGSPAGATPSADAALRFADVPEHHPFAADIAWLADSGIATGYDDDLFGPDRPVSRMAMAAFLHRYAGPGGTPTCDDAPFDDVPVSHVFCGEIAWMVEAGLSSGYDDGTFRPQVPVTRQAVAAFLARLAEPPALRSACVGEAPFADVEAGNPFCSEIAWLAGQGITTGYDDGGFHPAMVVTRMAFAALLHRYDAWAGQPVPSAGCGADGAAPTVNEPRDLTIGTSERSYILTVPTAHDGVTPLPLVLDFHGLGEGAQIHTAMSEASTFAEQEGFVVAFPHGRFEPVRWDAADQSDANEDLQLVDTIIEDLRAELCLDLSRTYAMGLSYGAIMTSMLTCTRSDVFAAVAPVAGVLAPTPCPQERPVPLLTFHGTEDAILPYEPYPVNAATWAERNGCAPEPTDTVLTDEVTHRVWDCPHGADVEMYILPGSGHVWPGSAFSQQIAAVVGYTTMDIHATAEAWAFFERFHL